MTTLASRPLAPTRTRRDWWIPASLIALTAVPALARSRVRRYAPVAQGLAAARDVVDGAASTSPDRGLVIQLDRRRRGPPRLPAA